MPPSMIPDFSHNNPSASFPSPKRPHLPPHSSKHYRLPTGWQDSHTSTYRLNFSTVSFFPPVTVVTASFTAAEFKMSLIDCPYAESDTDNIPQTAIPKNPIFFHFYLFLLMFIRYKNTNKNGVPTSNPFIYRSVKKRLEFNR